jgi:translation initiation factor 1
MSKKKKVNIVYSTNPNFNYDYESEEEEKTLPSNQQTLSVKLERHKGGKIATIVEGFVGSKSDLDDLGKMLKTKCGVGGSVKDGIIIVQGEKRDKVMELLNKEGYKTKRVGG